MVNIERKYHKNHIITNSIPDLKKEDYLIFTFFIQISAMD